MDDSSDNNREEEAINPCPPEWLDNEDNALLRGDAIGDTVYTHRWVLKCLFTITEGLPKYIYQDKISNNLSKDEISEKNESDNINDDDDKLNENESTSKSDALLNMEKTEKVIELDSEVEDAACQLWDMTVEKDVSLHLLNLEEFDILHLACLIFDLSCAPRLTEVMVGVVANLCCEEEGCNLLLQKTENDVLLSALRLMGSTSDVPTLCELMRLIRLLLWHRINRTPNTSWASCPLLKHLCQEYNRDIISFLLHNSLSDALLSSVLELLTSFLYVCLPETMLSVASLYSTESIINGLIFMLERKRFHLEKHLDDGQEQIFHMVILCLYAFIDTPGARLIQLSASSPDSKLEAILLSYIEHEGRVESPEELVGDTCERIIRVIGLSQLLIPTMKLPTLLLTVGKLIALISGETQQYSVRSLSKDEDDSDHSMDLVTKMKTKRKHVQKTKINHQATPISNPLVEDGGWLSPPAVPTILESNPASTSNTPTLPPPDNPPSPSVAMLASKDQNDCSSSPDKERCIRRSISSSSQNLYSNLKELKDYLEEFCYQLIGFWWSNSKDVDEKRRTDAQVVIFDVLDQCHAHEVLFILKAVRIKDSSLVPRLQEQILDSGAHQRLVALLAHMYQ